LTRDAPLGRPYWTLWLATMATNFGDGIRLVALPLFAVGITRDPALIALVTVFTYLPALLFGQIAGVIVDRSIQRRLIAISQLGRAIVLVAVAATIAINELNLFVLCFAAFLYGIGEALSDPASHAILPQIVAAEDLGRANSNLQSGQIVGEMFVGRALGGLLFAVAQPLPVWVNAALLLFAATVMVRMPTMDIVTPGSGGRGKMRRFFRELAEGFTVIMRSPLLRRMSVLLAVWASVSGAFWGIAAVYALRDLHATSVGFGVLLALAAIGSLAGARVAIPLVQLLGASTAAVLAVLLSSGSIIALTWTHEVWLASLLLGVNGAAVTLWNVLSVTIRQAVVQPHVLGRVSSTYLVLARTALPTGAAVAGALAAVLGAPLVFLFSGGFLALFAAILLPRLSRLLSEIWPSGQRSAARPDASTASS
jgi:MFS family permease